MAKLSTYFTILLFTSSIMIIGLIFFSNGFLVRRKAITKTTSCLRVENDFFIFENPILVTSKCLEPKAQVIILLVDALKYEFIQKFNDNSSDATYHRNKLPIIAEILKKYPKNSKVFKFIADPPTTTMQRLKGITTGTLPTFIDMHSNFAADVIVEDNFIDQNAQYGNIFMGDDTWINLYPNQFIRKYPAPSFDVSDLDTVDLEVKKQIFNEIENNDWTLLIGHMLGVDHCGHKHGMHHPEMLRKLNETNFLIEKLIAKINQGNKNIMLFVLGDHGMTDNGDHGGETADEIEAGMFVYSTIPLINVHKDFSFNKKIDTLENDVDKVYQVDFVPTISVILGNPIPFSNIGNLIIEALPCNYKNNSKVSDLNFVKHSLWKNIFQIQNYIDTYLLENSLGDEKLGTLKETYQNLFKKIEFVKNNSELKNIVEIADKYFNLVREILYKAWVQFDFYLIFVGLTLFICAIFLLYSIIDGLIEKKKIYKQYLMKILLRLLKIDSLILITISIGVFSNSFILEENKIFSFLLSTLFCTFVYPQKIFSIENIFIFVICLSIRISNNFWRYRDEKLQQEKNDSGLGGFVIGKAGSIKSKDIEMCYILFAVAAQVIYILSIEKWIYFRKSSAGYLSHKILAILIAVLTSIYWILKLTYLPLFIYVLLIIAISLIFYQPSAENFLTRVENSSKDNNESRNSIDNRLITCYNSCYVLLSVFLCLWYILLLGFVIAPSVILMNLVCIGTLYISTVNRINTSKNLDELLHVPNELVLSWFMIAEYFFFGTGHQSSFSTIHWDAGFIGIDSSIQVHFFQAILIVINTFGSHIILGIVLPLLVTIPFALISILPSLSKFVKKFKNTSVKNFENEESVLIKISSRQKFHYQIFSVSGRYILFHAIRVFFCMVSAYVNCRHLMVWNIFAPKFIFEGISFFISVFSVLLSMLLLLRLENHIQS